MDSFCSQCGSRIAQSDAFCPQCGAASASEVAAASTPKVAVASPPDAAPASVPGVAITVPAPARPKRRWPYWLILVVLAFIAGLWWGKHRLQPPTCTASASGLGAAGGSGAGSGGGGGAGGGGGGGGGSGGGGGGGAPPAAAGSGGALSGGAGGGAGGGGGGGGGAGGGSPGGPGGPANAQDGEDPLTKLAAGQLGLGDSSDRAGPPDPTLKVLTARDFTYDRTGLPRYGSAVRGVVSSMSTRSNNPDGFASSVGIVSTSSFEDVVNWYRSQLPAGWRNETIGDLQGLANALSPQAIASALGMGPANSSPSNPSGPSAPPAPSGSPTQISMFTPPPGTPDKPGIMIVTQDRRSVTILMSVHHGV